MTDVLGSHYATVAAARDHIKRVLDDSARGMSVTIRRERYTAAVIPAARLQELLARSVHAHVSIGEESGRCFAVMEGRPFATDGSTVEEALDDLVDSLREYAEDWHDHLRSAPNHASNWDLVQLVELSTDAQLREWLAA